MYSRLRRLAAALLLLAASALPCMAQTITGSIVGSVVDPSGLSVVDADVSVVHVATGVARQMKSDERGDFTFGSLQPGQYMLTVTAAGFKSLVKQQIMLSAAETLPVGRIALEVGAIADKVTVTAEGVAVQVASSERASVIANTQLEGLLTKSRNAMSLLSLMPGVVDGGSIGDTERMDRNFDINVQGNRRSTNTVTMDGMVTNPMGNNFNSSVTLGQDAIAEVKVLLTNYPAEYGRSSGATINLVTKSGAKDFHGLGSYFKRHEQFNANNFFNNRLGTPKQRYRYNTWNYNIGGPVVLPGGFNKNRDKLFFFWSQEFWPLKVSQAVRQLTVPTALERTGDFSQSVDLNNRLINVIDPNTKAQFPGNVIPASRLDSSGLALTKVFPMPNFNDRGISAGRYNYVEQSVNDTPLRMENLRMDYNLTPKHTLAFTFASFLDRQTGGYGVLTNTGANWSQIVKTYQLRGQGYVLRYTGILSPTLINEMGLGFTRRPEGNSATDDEVKRNTRAAAGYTAAQFSPAANPLSFIPNATFGGVTNAASLFMEGRFPFQQNLQAFNLTNNLTKTLGAHTLKAGIMIERNYQGSNGDGNFAGAFSFANDTNNPLNTGYAYSNAALGVFSTYTEPSSRVYLHFRQHAVEWFAQDSWRATRRLTLELGVRFHYLVPIYMSTDKLSSFSSGLYDPAKAVQLIQPTRANGVRVGVHPVTGVTYPAALIGAIAPGTGDAADGMAVSGQNGYPRSLIDTYGLRAGPRFGFAYDVFGNAKTAVRGGIGMFYNRPNMSDNYILFSSQLPIVSNPTVYYSTIGSLLSSSGATFPQSVNGLDRTDKLPKVINYSFSVQQDIGFKTVVDVGYIGSLGRNLLWRRNLNPIPLGANFQAANADPSNPSTPLASAFLRPLKGYNDVLLSEPAGSSNYHSMQVTARRRFTQSVQFGLSWTWSKAMDYADFDTTGVSVQVPVRVWNYGLASFDRTHIFKLDWVWNLPKAPVQSRVARYALHDWQLSGITSFISGSPLGIGYATTNSLDITGSATQGARVVVLGDAVLSKGERTFSRNFKTEMFARPAVGTVGNAATTQIRGPGVNNFDMSLFKDFPIRESMKLQFRAEAYNLFNHTQFSGLDTTARFDASGNQVNTNFGAFTAARGPRILQFALRFYF